MFLMPFKAFKAKAKKRQTGRNFTKKVLQASKRTIAW
jgi:hypothetical protein